MCESILNGKIGYISNWTILAYFLLVYCTIRGQLIIMDACHVVLVRKNYDSFMHFNIPNAEMRL